MRILVALAASAALLVGCYGPDPNLTDEGKGLPVLTLDFPEEVKPESVHEAVLTVDNPGPEDMDSIVVAFSRLGDPALPLPLVEVSGNAQSPVRSVDPEPQAVGQGGVLFIFEGLPEGETMTITFELRVPNHEGTVGNAVQVYDGSDTNRARGVRLEAEVTR